MKRCIKKYILKYMVFSFCRYIDKIDMLPMFLELYVFEYEQFIYIKDLKVMIMRRKKMELKYRKKKGEKKNNQYRFCTKI